MEPNAFIPSDTPAFSAFGSLSEEAALFSLAALAAFVDTAGFIALFGLFTAHVTGNFILAGQALAMAQEREALSRLGVVPVFMVSVSGAWLFARWVRTRKGSVLASLLFCEAIALLFFTGVGIFRGARLTESNNENLLAVGFSGVIAMGIQNLLMKEALAQSPPTTVMTGNLVQWTISATLLLFQRWAPCWLKATLEETRVAQKQLVRLGWVLSGFVVGAIGGAFGVARLHFWCLLLPAFVALALSLLARTVHLRRKTV